MPTFEELIGMYPAAVEKRDAARRAADEKKAVRWGGPQLWLLEISQLEAAHALSELTVRINHADPALERLRALLIDELETAARSFDAAPAALPAIPGLSDPTPGAVLAKAEAL